MKATVKAKATTTKRATRATKKNATKTKGTVRRTVKAKAKTATKKKPPVKKQSAADKKAAEIMEHHVSLDAVNTGKQPDWGKSLIGIAKKLGLTPKQLGLTSGGTIRKDGKACINATRATLGLAEVAEIKPAVIKATLRKKVEEMESKLGEEAAAKVRAAAGKKLGADKVDPLFIKATILQMAEDGELTHGFTQEAWDYFDSVLESYASTKMAALEKRIAKLEKAK
jgi:hypothetical protein